MENMPINNKIIDSYIFQYVKNINYKFIRQIICNYLKEPLNIYIIEIRFYLLGSMTKTVHFYMNYGKKLNNDEINFIYVF